MVVATLGSRNAFFSTGTVKLVKGYGETNGVKYITEENLSEAKKDYLGEKAQFPQRELTFQQNQKNGLDQFITHII